MWLPGRQRLKDQLPDAAASAGLNSVYREFCVTVEQELFLTAVGGDWAKISGVRKARQPIQV
jgi:hypothetical protein